MKSGVGKRALFVEHTTQLVLRHLVFVDARNVAFRLVMEQVARDELQSVLHGLAERLAVVHAEEDLAAVGSATRCIDKHIEERLQVLVGAEGGRDYVSAVQVPYTLLAASPRRSRCTS